MTAYAARYRGRCPACEEVITPGDPCVYDEGELVHADCESATPERTARQVCDACWTEITPSGACDCDGAA